MEPITRKEQLIADIVAGSGSTEIDAVDRIEVYLTDIIEGNVSTLEPRTRTEAYLAKISGADVDLPVPLVRTRIEMYLAKIAGEDVVPPEPVTRLEWFLSEWAEAGPGVFWKTVYGEYGYYEINNAMAYPIKSFIVRQSTDYDTMGVYHGLSITPATSDQLTGGVDEVPMYNSGARLYNTKGTITRVDNEIPSNYVRVAGMKFNGDDYFQIFGFKMRGSDTIRVSMSVSAACNVFGAYQSTSSDNNYSLYVSTASGAKYLRYNGGTYKSYWSNASFGERFDIVITPTGSHGMPTGQDDTWQEVEFESENDLFIGTTSATATSAKFKGTIYGNIVVDGRLKLIPCVNGSGNVCYYDTYSQNTYYPNYLSVTPLEYDTSHVEIQYGLPYARVQDSAGHSVALDALNAIGVGGTIIKDEQSIADGTITRRTKIVTLDGTENITSTEYGSHIFVIRNANTLWGVPAECSSICTHFTGYPNWDPVSSVIGTCYFDYDGNFYMHSRYFNTLETFVENIRLQHGQRTPVTILLPLTTENYYTEASSEYNPMVAGGRITIISAGLYPVIKYTSYTSGSPNPDYPSQLKIGMNRVVTANTNGISITGSRSSVQVCTEESVCQIAELPDALSDVDYAHIPTRNESYDSQFLDEFEIISGKWTKRVTLDVLSNPKYSWTCTYISHDEVYLQIQNIGVKTNSSTPFGGIGCTHFRPIDISILNVADIEPDTIFSWNATGSGVGFITIKTTADRFSGETPEQVLDSFISWMNAETAAGRGIVVTYVDADAEPVIQYVQGNRLETYEGTNDISSNTSLVRPIIFTYALNATAAPMADIAMADISVLTD